MTLTFPNTIINEFPDLNFIGGSYKELSFFIKSNNILLDLTGYTGVWSLSPYSQLDYPLLSLTTTCSNGLLFIEILSTYTENLSGKFIQEAKVLLIPGYLEYKLGRGIVNIIPRIGIIKI